ncbi:MAG: tetratricopeptide repeat protein [Planctomycetes bacterium]|nr:tetratricopeptide repeat protein [Planctomycetota bacterium]
MTEDNLITPSDYFHRGMDRLENGKFAEAVDYFKQAIQHDYQGNDLAMPMGEALFELGRAEEALEWFNRASSSDTAGNEDVLLWKGSAYLELGKHRRAISCFNRVIELNANLAEAHFKRGLVLSEMGNPDRALEAFDRAQTLLEDDNEAQAEVLLWKGRTLTRLGRRAEGLQLMFEAHEKAPDVPGPYNEIADAYRFNGDLGAAEEWYLKGLKRLPEDPSLHNDYGNLLRDLGRMPDSLQHLTVAIEHDANRAVAYYNRALTLERMGRGDDALKDYDTVIEANPNDVDCKLRKVDLMAQLAMFKDARDLLSSLTPEQSKTAEAEEAAARVHNREALHAELHGDLDRALASHGAAIKLHPDFLDVESPGEADDTPFTRMTRLVNLVAKLPKGDPREGVAKLLEGAARYKLREKELSQAALEQALALGAERPLALTLLAELTFYEFSRDKKALSYAEEALKLRPDFVRALWIKATVLADGLGQPQEAVACYRRMLEITPGNPSVLLNLGDLFFDHGQPHRALDCYRKVLEDRPGDVSVNRDIGLCYLALERFGEAIACFSRLDAAGTLQFEIKLDLADAHLAVGDRAEAAKLIDEVREGNQGMDPNVGVRCQEMTAALENARKAPKLALAALKGLGNERLSTYGLVQSGKAKLALGEYKGARHDLKEVLRDLDPRAGDAVEARYYLARVAFAEGKHGESLELLDEIMPLAPFDQRIYRFRSWVQMLQGEIELSEQTSEGGRFAELVARCHRLLSHEDFREAAASARGLIGDYPARVELRYYLACALAQLGEDEQALEELRTVLKSEPNLKKQMLDEFYLEPLRLADRHEFRNGNGGASASASHPKVDPPAPDLP